TDGAVGRDAPVEDAHVVRLGSDLEDREQEARLREAELRETSAFVVAVELAELPDELGIREHARLVLGVLELEPFRPRHEAVEAENVTDRRLAQVDRDVEPEEQPAADLHDVAREAVVLGADARAADDGQLAAAVGRLPALVERVGLGAELLGLFGEARAQDLVAARLEGLRAPIRDVVHARRASITPRRRTR